MKILVLPNQKSCIGQSKVLYCPIKSLVLSNQKSCIIQSNVLYCPIKSLVLLLLLLLLLLLFKLNKKFNTKKKDVKYLCDADVVSYFFYLGAIKTRNIKETSGVVDAFFNYIYLPFASIWDFKVS